MNIPVEYLAATKAEEVASQLRAEGYEVMIPAGPASGYDLTAAKDGRKLAVVIKVQSELQGTADELSRLRKQAHEQGYGEFRLAVAHPPHQVNVEVEDLEEVLYDYLLKNFPEKLNELSSATRLGYVADVVIDTVEVTREGIRVAGSGVIGVELEWGGGEERDGFSVSDDFPFSFDITLNHTLEVAKVHSLLVDTSSFYE